MSTTATTHSTEPGALRWYRRLVWAGIVSNIAVSIVSIIYPAEVLAFVGVDPATPLIWPRLAVMLLALLSIFYIPAALDPCAHRFSAIFAVVCRFAAPSSSRLWVAAISPSRCSTSSSARRRRSVFILAGNG
jgi:uncharacterized membrane protein